MRHARPEKRGAGVFRTISARWRRNHDGPGLYPLIEEFRQARQRAGLSHFGLDYYVANDHVIFTWQHLSK